LLCLLTPERPVQVHCRCIHTPGKGSHHLLHNLLLQNNQCVVTVATFHPAGASSTCGFTLLLGPVRRSVQQ
jgi:hypothetical protein